MNRIVDKSDISDFDWKEQETQQEKITIIAIIIANAMLRLASFPTARKELK